jgi:hypothetical protein
MISSLQFTNIKGRKGDYVLSPVVAILGENASGKTSIVDALDYAMHGQVFHQSIGKTNAEIFKLCSSDEMVTTIALADGRKATRRLAKRGDKVSAIADGAIEFPAILRDANLYFSLSDKARIALVASLVKMDDAVGFSIPEILASVKNISLGEKNSEASEQAILAAYNELAHNIGNGVPLDWLAANIENVKTQIKHANAKRKTLTATNIGITLLQNADADQATASSLCETKLRDARRVLGVLQTESGRLAGLLAEAQRKQKRKDELAAIAKPSVDLDALKMNRHLQDAAVRTKRNQLSIREHNAQWLWGEVTKLQAQIAAAQDEMQRIVIRKEQLEAIKQPAVDALALNENQSLLAARIKELESLCSNRAITTELVASNIAQWTAQKDEQARIYKDAKSQIGALCAEAKAFLAHDKCPTCLAAGGGWKLVWESEQQKKIAVWQERMDAALVEGKQLSASITRAEEVLKTQRAGDLAMIEARRQHESITHTLVSNVIVLDAYRQAQGELAQKRIEQMTNVSAIQHLNELLVSAKSNYAQAKKQDDDLAELVAQLEAVDKEIEDANDSLKAWNEAQQELAKIGEVFVNAAAGAVATNNADIAAQMLVIADLEEKHKTVQLARADLRRQMEAATAADKAQSECDVLKAVKELLEKKQSDLVATAFASLLKVVNRFTSVVLPHEIVYHENECGYFKRGQFVSASTFSGVEELVMFVGLCVSLAAQSKERIVVIDEMTRAIGETKQRLVNQLLSLCKDGVIHQAIVVDGPCAIYNAIAANNADISIINVA